LPAFDETAADGNSHHNEAAKNPLFVRHRTDEKQKLNQSVKVPRPMYAAYMGRIDVALPIHSVC
jgi:hypothetical protein